MAAGVGCALAVMFVVWAINIVSDISLHAPSRAGDRISIIQEDAEDFRMCISYTEPTLGEAGRELTICPKYAPTVRPEPYPLLTP